MAFHIFCRAAIEATPLTVFGDGRQTRDFTYVKDVVAATIAAAEAPLEQWRVFNVGGGTPTSIRAVLELIGELAARKLEVDYLDTERGDVRDTAADTTRAETTLGFAPTTTLADGLGAEFEWLAELIAARDGQAVGR
jgi:UDP-glucose 4-epimerase